jgi:LytTr DNA-binding domain
LPNNRIKFRIMLQPNFDASNRRVRLIFSILGGVYLNIFILLFQPYQGDIFAYTTPFYYQFVFGGIVSVVYVFTAVVVPDFFPRYFTQPYFTPVRFVIWYLFSGLLCHFPSFFYDNWLGNMPNTWAWFMEYELKYALPTLIFTSIPFLMFAGFLFYKKDTDSQEGKEIAPFMEEKESDELKSIDENLESVETPPQYIEAEVDNVIKLSDITKKNVFEITKKQLIYIESTNNYVEIFYTDESNVLNRTLLRQTLKEIDNQLVKEGNAFCRCHNEYIINKEKIISITGNAKGYQLILRGSNKPIPVSRSKNEKLITQFIHLLNV